MHRGLFHLAQTASSSAGNPASVVVSSLATQAIVNRLSGWRSFLVETGGGADRQIHFFEAESYGSQTHPRSSRWAAASSVHDQLRLQVDAFPGSGFNRSLPALVYCAGSEKERFGRTPGHFGLGSEKQELGRAVCALLSPERGQVMGQYPAGPTGLRANMVRSCANDVRIKRAGLGRWHHRSTRPIQRIAARRVIRKARTIRAQGASRRRSFVPEADASAARNLCRKALARMRNFL